MSDVIFAQHIEMSRNILKQALMDPRTSAPTGPSTGQAYFDLTLMAIGLWVGDHWRYGGVTLDLMDVPQNNVDMGGFRFTNTHDPVNPQDFATMAWVLANAAGIRDTKDNVRIASNGALPAYTRSGNVITATSNGAFPAIDTITMTAADSVEPSILLKDGAAGADNGIYVLTRTGSAGTTWQLTRRGDADQSSEMTSGVYVWVLQGSFADKGFLLTTVDPIVLNTTALSFTIVSGLGLVTAGLGLTKSGDTIDVGAGTGIICNANDVAIDPSVVVRKASATIGDNATTDIDVVHGLNSRDCIVEVYQSTTPWARVVCDIKHKDANTVTCSFSLPPTTNQYRVVVHD